MRCPVCRAQKQRAALNRHIAPEIVVSGKYLRRAPFITTFTVLVRTVDEPSSGSVGFVIFPAKAASETFERSTVEITLLIPASASVDTTALLLLPLSPPKE